MATKENQIIMDVPGVCFLWSGPEDLVFDGETYRPGVLLGDDFFSGTLNSSGDGPQIDIDFRNCLDFFDRVRAGQEVRTFFIQRIDLGAWVKLPGGYSGIIMSARLSGGRAQIVVGHLLERFSRSRRPRWSHLDHLSRNPNDNWFEDLPGLRAKGFKIKFP